jgi:predicted transcriptional regulator
MGKHRDHLGIIAAILDASESGACKTRIMINASLNFKLLEKYLNNVLRLGFVQAEDQFYSLTAQGRDFLEEYRHFHERHVYAQELLKFLDLEHKRLSSLCENSQC